MPSFTPLSRPSLTSPTSPTMKSASPGFRQMTSSPFTTQPLSVNTTSPTRTNPATQPGLRAVTRPSTAASSARTPMLTGRDVKQAAHRPSSSSSMASPITVSSPYPNSDRRISTSKRSSSALSLGSNSAHPASGNKMTGSGRSSAASPISPTYPDTENKVATHHRRSSATSPITPPMHPHSAHNASTQQRLPSTASPVKPPGHPHHGNNKIRPRRPSTASSITSTTYPNHGQRDTRSRRPPALSPGAIIPSSPDSGPKTTSPFSSNHEKNMNASRGLQRRSSTRAFLFSPAPEGGRSPATHSPGLQGPAAKRDPKKLFYSVALMAVHSRRMSGGCQRGRQASGQGRRFNLAGHRRSSSERLAQVSSVASFVGLQQRRLWGKVRLWCRIINILSSMLRKHATAAKDDPSSPFYSHAPGSLVVDLVDAAIDKDHYMFFDPAHFKANRQRRVSSEVQKILTKPPEERTPEEVNFVMIGLRDIPQLAVYPVRMQRNLAQFGQFQCFDAKRMVLKQGHRPEGFYIILYGNVAVAVKNEETGFVNIVVELPRGESFGELSIVSGGLRNSSVLTTTYTELLCITKPVYESIFMTGGMKNVNDPDQNEFLSSLPFLRGWPVEIMGDKRSQKYVRFMYIQRNGVIMRDSNHNNWLVVVKSGSVTVLKKLVCSKPTVSSRTGHYREGSGSTAYQSFLTNAREYARYNSSHAITLPPPLQLKGDSEGEEEEVEEEEDIEEEEEYEEGFDEEEEEVLEDDGENDLEDEDDGDDDEEDGEGCGRQEGEGAVETTRRQGMVVRPQTCDQGTPSSPMVHSPRKAWSAKHSAPGSKAPVLTKAVRQKRAKIHFEGDDGATQAQTRQELKSPGRFAAAKRTVLDDLDASYFASERPHTEADINPQFVHVQTLTKGDVFGLAPIVFPDQPSLCLVSNGAECMLIDKHFYMDHCPLKLSQRLKTEVSPYPSEAKLQQDLVNRINWDVYKRAVKRQLWEQAPSRVTSRFLWRHNT